MEVPYEISHIVNPIIEIIYKTCDAVNMRVTFELNIEITATLKGMISVPNTESEYDEEKIPRNKVPKIE